MKAIQSFIYAEKNSQKIIIAIEESLVKMEIKNMIPKQTNGRIYNKKYRLHLQRKQIIKDSIYKLCAILDYNLSTFYTSISLFDSFASRYQCDNKFLKCIFLICLMIVSKINQKKHKILTPPLVQEFLEQYDLKVLMNIEQKVLLNLDFDLNILTPHDFLSGFFQLEESFSSNGKRQEEIVIKNLKIAMKKLLYISVLNYESYKYTSLGIACTIIFIARDIEGIEDPWSEQLVEISGIQFEDLESCKDFFYNEISRLHKDEPLIDETNSHPKEILMKFNVLTSSSSDNSGP